MNISVTYKNIDTAINAAKMFELRKLVSVSIMEGNFRNARIAQKEFAKAAVADLDTFKTLPNIKFTNVPLGEWLTMAFRTLEYKFYRFFTGRSKEEKALAKSYKQMLKTNA